MVFPQWISGFPCCLGPTLWDDVQPPNGGPPGRAARAGHEGRLNRGDAAWALGAREFAICPQGCRRRGKILIMLENI